jgi:hypothetical protein
MFSVGNSVEPSLLLEISSHLQKHPLEINVYRKNSGIGRSQCFGIVRQRNGTYTGSRYNYKRPSLYQSLISLGNKILPPDFSYTSIQLNQNYPSLPHYDKGNKGISAIIGFGDYSGGELKIEETSVCIKNRLVFFDGSKYLHQTLPFTGTRYSIVFFTVNKTFSSIPVFSFTVFKDKLVLEECMENVVKLYDKNGDVICSSDNTYIPRIQRTPTLRPCIESNSE